MGTPSDEGFYEWMQEGIAKKYCGPPICYTHDGLPMTEEEENHWSFGDDPCITIIRIYESHEEADEIIAKDFPTQWRAFPYEA